MCKFDEKHVLECFEDAITTFFYLESIINLTKEKCLTMEINSNYYNLNNNDRLNLSKERNDYINMLALSLEKISILKEFVLSIEKEVHIYNNTPTIAADK